MKKIALAFALALSLASCSSSEDISAPSEETVSNTSDEESIPMSDSHENGRYSLLSRTTENGIETIEYVRKGDTSNSYGKMQIKCATHEIRKYSSSSADSLNNADLGEWVSVQPGWTDEDIVTFICT